MICVISDRFDLATNLHVNSSSKPAHVDVYTVSLQSQEAQCPIHVAQVGSKACVSGFRHQNHSSTIYLDVNEQWPQLSGTLSDGAVLVRPDGHVLWRCKSLAKLSIPQTGQQQLQPKALLQRAKASMLTAIQTSLGRYVTYQIWDVGA